MNTDSARSIKPAISKRLRSILKKTGKVILLLLVIGLVVHSILLVVWGRALEGKLSKIRAQGQPVNMVDLMPKPVPENENAAVVYQKAFALYKEGPVQPGHGVDEVGVPQNFLSQTGPKERVALESQVRKVIDDNKAVFPLLQQAVAKPRCVFPINWKDGINAQLPHLFKLRHLTLMVAARAIIDSQDGKMDAALDDTTLALGMARASDEEPCLISFLVQLANTRYALAGLQEAVRTSPLSQEQARRMYDRLAEINIEPAFIRAMQGERAFSNWFFDIARTNPQLIYREWGRWEYNQPPREEPGALKKAALWTAVFLWKPLSYKDQQIALKLWDGHMALLEKPYRESAASLTNIENSVPKYSIITRIAAPNYSRVLVARDRNVAETRLAQVAMALKAYKSRFGSYPDALSGLKKLGWSIPTDPFSGKPFEYSRNGEGFVLYSWGQNLKDDGGKVNEDLSGQSSAGKADIIWTCEK